MLTMYFVRCFSVYLNKQKRNTMTTTQITTAETFGMINHEQGMKKVPAQSKELMNMLSGRQVGEKIKGQASSAQLMAAWARGYDKAQRIQMEAKFGF